MGLDLTYRDKVPVAILGATGSVGQKLVELLAYHPWFEICALGASERSAGKRYGETVNWILPTPLPAFVADMTVGCCEPPLNCPLIFSGLDSGVAGEIEKKCAETGSIVVSNARNHRMEPDVPLVVPEVNGSHLELMRAQKFGKGKIITNPNCSVAGMVIALKPLVDRFGLEAVHVVTMQALSGAGHPGVASLDIMDNVIPYIKGEEHKIQTEPLKILGTLLDTFITPLPIKISAQCNRVAVMDGHLGCISVKLKQQASKEDIIHEWESFKGEPQTHSLPMAPLRPIHYFKEDHYPQPRLHRMLDKGMAVSVGRLQHCTTFDYKFVFLSHNTIRGAAGAAILNAELLLKKGHIFW